MYVIAKIMASAIVIAVITEISRRFPTYGGILAALPLVSILSIIWLYVQGEQTSTLSKFILGVIWGIPATMVFLLIIYFTLQKSFHLFISIGFGLCGWLLFLAIQNYSVRFVKILFFNS